MLITQFNINGTTGEFWLHSHRCGRQPLPQKVIYTRGISWYHTSWNILAHPSILVYVIYFLPFLWHACVQSTKSFTDEPGSSPGLASWTLPPASSSSYVGGSGGYRIHVHHSNDRFSLGSHHLKKSNASWSLFFNPHMFVHSTYIFCKNCGIVHVEDVVDCDELP